MTTDTLPFSLPEPATDAIVVEAPGDGFGNWAGAPAAWHDQDGFVLAWRVRRPVGEGRGVGTVVGRSVDGVRFDEVVTITKDRFGAESLERPALVRADARWYLYLSCATPDTKHWRVDLLVADTLEELAEADPVTVLPGSDLVGVKDPVVQLRDGRWHMWLCCHPLEDPDATDRMWTEYLTSSDGRGWENHGVALRPEGDAWDARGTRITAVTRDGDRWIALYDGRASAQENFEERTGLAIGEDPGSFVAAPDVLAQAPDTPHGLRYLALLETADGTTRAYYEVARPDGSHEIRVHVSR